MAPHGGDPPLATGGRSPRPLSMLPPLPWMEPEITSILPHREPFLFVDRVLELDPQRRVVGSRTWAGAEAVEPLPDGGRAVPVPYLVECMAQVGAVLILSRPECRGRLIYFLGIERARVRRAVRAGDTLHVEAEVRRLRSRMGTLGGVARVDGRVVAEGTMTFALPAGGGA